MTRTKTPARRARRDYVRYGLGIAGDICARIAEGANWTQLSREPRMPARPTYYDWMREHPEFADMVARAEEMRADTQAYQALEVAMGTNPGVSGDRLRVSTLLWHAAKGCPARYGTAAEKVRKPGEELPPPPMRNITVRIRDFQPLTLPDGRTITREMRRDGSHVDHD